MTPTDKQLVTMTGFPAGINNQVREDALPVDANTGAQTSLRQAVNVYLPNNGKPQMRDGYTQITAGIGGSSFTGPQGMFAVIDGDLKLYDANLASTTVIAGIGERDISYAVVNGEVYWSNSIRIGRIDANGVSKPVWIGEPGQPTVAAYATGGLAAGDYQVALAWLDDTGRLSGCSLATVVTLTQGQGIRLTNIPPNPDAATVRVYVTPTNGEALYWAADFPAGTSTYIIGNTQRGALLETQWLELMPPGQIVRAWNGMLLVASQNIVWRSEVHRYGLKRYDNYNRYHGYVSLMEPVGQADVSGVFIAVNDERPGKSRTYFVTKGDEWKQVTAFPHGAIEGTVCQESGDVFGEVAEGYATVAYWVADNGQPVIGLPSGRVKPLTADRFVTPLAERGATLFRDTNGIRQMISSLLGSTTNQAAVGDFATAEVRRNGVTV